MYIFSFVSKVIYPMSDLYIKFYVFVFSHFSTVNIVYVQ